MTTIEQPVIRVSFHVLFANSERGDFYGWGQFKTFFWARRYVRRTMGWSFRDAHKVDSWAIERHVSVGIRLHESSCVLAQSKNFPEWHDMKRENMLRFRLPFSLAKSRYPKNASESRQP